MSEKPYDKILHRELHCHDAQERYRAQIELLIDVVNYGSNLIPACFHSSKRTLGDTISITVLLKQLVLMLDGFQVLITNACSEAAILQCRAIFEASIYLDWILSKDTEKKALYFYVANVRKERQWVKRSIPNDLEQEKFFNGLGEFGKSLEETKIRLADSAPARLKEIDEFLNKEPYFEINKNFDNAKGNKSYDPAWYVPLGEHSVRGLSKTLGRLHEYEFFYSEMSETMHASSHKSHIKIGKGEITIEPIRNLSGLALSINFALSMTFYAYRKILKHYRPGQLTEFANRYVRDWREAYTHIPEVNYKSDPNKSYI